MFGLFFILSFFSLVLLVVGLFKPSVIPKNTSRKKSSLIFGLGMIIFFILMGVTAPPSSSKTTDNSLQNSETTPLPTAISFTPETTVSNKQTVKVIRVIDGDTIEIEGGQKVRYIGIDTPETVHPSKPVQCYGKEASDKNKELVEGKTVELEKDISETDKYGRLLRYVWIENLLINEFLVQEGYAQSSSYPPDIKYQESFLEAQKKAREEGKGLWGETCAITPIPTRIATPTPTIIYQPQTTQAPSSLNTNSCKYSCSGPDRDCSDFSTHAEAQTFFDCCGFTANNDPMKLDSVGVGDGIACESLP